MIQLLFLISCHNLWSKHFFLLETLLILIIEINCLIRLAKSWLRQQERKEKKKTEEKKGN